MVVAFPVLCWVVTWGSHNDRGSPGGAVPKGGLSPRGGAPMAQCPHGRAAMQGRSCLPSPRSHSPAALQLESCECDVWQPPPPPPALSPPSLSPHTDVVAPTAGHGACSAVRVHCTLALPRTCLCVLARAHLQMATAACAFPRACVLAHACVCACFLARLQVGSHVRPSVHTCVSAGGGMAALCSCAHACARAVTPQGRGDTCPPPHPHSQAGGGR